MLARELVSQHSGTDVLALLGSNSATFTATGTTAATAAALTTSFTNINAGAAFTGAILPVSMNPSDVMRVCNATSTEKCVYPPSGGKLNGATANVPCVMPANCTKTFTCVNGTDWSVDSI